MFKKSRLRDTKRVDYKTYGNSGKKVLKKQTYSCSKMAALIEEELKISAQLDRFYSEYELEILLEVGEIEEAIKEFKILANKYEEVHIRLRRELGEEDYELAYENVGAHLRRIKEWIRNAKVEVKNRKLAASSEREREKLDTVRAEEKYFRMRISSECESMCLEDSFFVTDLEKHIESAQALLQGYTNIFVKIESFGPEFSAEFKNTYEEQSVYLNGFINKTKQKIRTIKLAALEEEKQKGIFEEQFIEEKEKRETIVTCESIYQNICERFESLEKKCNVNIEDLDDSNVLNTKTDFKLRELDFKEILDLVTKLCGLDPNRFSETSKMNEYVNVRKDRLKILMAEHQSKVEQEILSRDLSYEKVKNSSVLGINIPKFKGYNSEIDYYSFKSEFEKLIVPRIQKKLLPDFLRRNYLGGQALQLVLGIDDIDGMWDRLKMAYGNVANLISMKTENLGKEFPLWKVKGDEMVLQSLIKLKNSMGELKSLAVKHGMEHNLFHTSNLAKIMQLLGRKRQLEVTKGFLGSNKSELEKWDAVMKFLDEEIKIKEQCLLLDKHVRKEDNPRKRETMGEGNYPSLTLAPKSCAICDKTDHIPSITSKGNAIVNYFACEKFAKMSPRQRFEELKGKKFCLQCLSPGLKAGHEGRCFDKYKCPDESHNRYKRGLHVLVCDRHKHNRENIEILDAYKSKCINNVKEMYAEFSNNIGIAYPNSESNDVAHNKTNEGAAIYMFQRIKVEDKSFNLFFDSGCGDMVIRKTALDSLQKMGRTKNIRKGPLTINGVGNTRTICEHGRFRITLPLFNGPNVNLTGICLDEITCKFPIYCLGEAEMDIWKSYVAAGGGQKLPTLPKRIGGEVDIMLGIQYYKYFPKEIFRTSSGLCIFESQFSDKDGSRGIIGGPHDSFTRVQNNTENWVNSGAYFLKNTKEYCNEFWASVDTGLLDIPTSETISNYDHGPSTNDNVAPYTNIYLSKRTPKLIKQFEKVEKAGTEVSYRCLRCRGCLECRKSEMVEVISLQEEMEQELVNKSVSVSLNEGCTSAYLPFLCDPTKKLASNYHIAEKIYYSQIRRLNSNSCEKKNALISSVTKLINLGYLSSYENLGEAEKRVVDNSPVKYFIPWLTVWNDNSISTPCRPVFNASSPTDSGYSLNDLLPKGRNNLNKLVQIFIRWTSQVCAFHTDIQKMYNAIKLNPEHWCFQLFLWDNELSLNKKPTTHVIKTLIYGVKTSGNQAERALRETATFCMNEYPKQYQVIQDDIYVDDCLSGGASYEVTKTITDDLQIVLSKGGFRLKGITFSGFAPPPHLSKDQESILVGGIRWFPKPDLISLNLGDFGKNCSQTRSNKKENRLTRRECVGRVGEIFDITGRFAPLLAAFKLDLNELCSLKLDWDDYVPSDLVPKWEKNFQTILEMREIRFKRCVVPDDAVSLEMETIEMGDSSLYMACAAVYVRFKRKNGLYSCQLIFARSKIVPKGMSIPRAELFAAVLNATTGHIVNLSLKNFIKNRISLTDSQVALFWISNPEMQLKQWVRNRVIEINRLTDKTKWFYIESCNMTADIGTRAGAKIADVLDGSQWVNGQDWAKYEKKSFPIRSVGDIRLSKEEAKGLEDEVPKLGSCDPDWVNKQLSVMYCTYTATNKEDLSRIKLRYEFSKYIVDPAKFRFRKVIRIVALILLFVRNLKSKVGLPNRKIIGRDIPEYLKFCNDMYLVTSQNCVFPFMCKGGLVVKLNSEHLLESLHYFYKLATSEIKHFGNKKKYEKIAKEREGILYYVGRILPSQQIDSKVSLSDVCLDLCMSSLCVPLIDRYSPLAYAVINEVHWHDPEAKHSGNETTMRYVQEIAHILQGRDLVKQFRSECPRCRYLNSKAVEVAMGPKSCNNLTIAPAFYFTQVDLFGPYNAFSRANKRATVKIWFVVFCCCVTGAIDIKVLEDYTTDSFVLGFIRFSCKVGYPRKLLIDAGSQLIKGCESMEISFSDTKNKLYNHGVEYEVCPVGAHYMQGKVERKIRHIKESFSKELYNNRLSIMQWEPLGDQVANSINNLPIAIGNLTEGIENLGLLTPNRLLLARNNARNPIGALNVSHNLGDIVEQNNRVVQIWFKAWLTSYVPSLMFHPKWFKSDKDINVGDVVLFLKSEKEFDKSYQYGIICEVHASRDGKIRRVEVEYQNSTEKVKRRTIRGTREVVVIHPFDKLGLMRELNILATTS